MWNFSVLAVLDIRTRLKMEPESETLFNIMLFFLIYYECTPNFIYFSTKKKLSFFIFLMRALIF